MHSKLTKIADYGDLCGEAPLWDAAAERLLWSDCVGKKLYEYKPNIQRHRLLESGYEVNGLVLNADGGFILTNNAGYWWWDGGTQRILLGAEVDGHNCQLNDCEADPAGRVLSCSVFYDPAAEYQIGKLMVLDTDRTVRILDEGFHLGNGMGFSGDGRTLYATDSAQRCIYAYDYDCVSGAVRNRRVFVQDPDNQGLPDGLEVDSQDYIWSAKWYGSCVVRYDPCGKIERTISTPAKQTSSLAFGGRDLADIYITSAQKPEPMPIMPPGYSPDTGYVGGGLFHVNLGLRGRERRKARITI